MNPIGMKVSSNDRNSWSSVSGCCCSISPKSLRMLYSLGNVSLYFSICFLNSWMTSTLISTKYSSRISVYLSSSVLILYRLSCYFSTFLESEVSSVSPVSLSSLSVLPSLTVISDRI